MKKIKIRHSCFARLRISGVDIYSGRECLAGITEREAIKLYASLSKLLPKIKAAIKKYDL